MNIKAMEKEMERLVEIIKKDDTELNACYEYVKLFDSARYLEVCGFLTLSFHKEDRFEEMKDWCTIARMRITKFNNQGIY